MADAQPDFVELGTIKNRCLAILPWTSTLSIVTLVSYLGLRLSFNIEAYWATNNLTAVLNSSVYLMVEAGLLFPNFLNHLFRCLARPSPGSQKVKHLRLLNMKNPPLVDVFITCAGEEFDTITNTIHAACALDYPTHRFRVIVLDDAGSKELSRHIEDLKKSRTNVFYTARKKGANHHFKAGNLNHGFRYVENFPEGPADFIAALDADMIPDPKWLRALLPHMLQNEKMALVQPPQRFYDVPTHDPLLQGLDVNFKVTEPLREVMGSTWCGGSGYLIRRAAIDSIGGFPTDSVGEDMYCSNVLLGKGWKTLYVDETLQYGRVPDSYKAHVKQQSRWHVGRVQTAIAMRFYLFGERSNKMGIHQRGAGLISTCISLANITTTIALILLPMAMGSGQPLVFFPRTQDLRILLAAAIACFTSEWLDDCVVALITGYKIALSEGHASYWIAPYHTAALIDAFLPRWLRPGTFEFSSSGSSNPTNERDSDKRAPLHGRLLDILWYNKAGLHLIYSICLCLGVARSCMAAYEHNNLTTESWANNLLVYLCWPPLLWLVCLNSVAIPMLYAIFPPTIPNHEQLLKHDPSLRASYPQEKRSETDYFLLREDVCYTFCMVCVLGLMGAVWYL